MATTIVPRPTAASRPVPVPRRCPGARRSPAARAARAVAPRLFLLLALALSLAVGLAPVLTVPAVVAASAPATEFSAERALAHVRALAAEPHPMGSPEHDAAVAYLVEQLAALGLDPEVQVSSVAATEEVAPGVTAVAAGRVHNVVARLPGTDSTGAVLLIGSYDSMPTTPGAADPVSGGAALLETLRALRSGPPLRNDVIAAFIDVEPAGLLGDRAFAREHRWGRDASVALAFPALGMRGPVLLWFASPERGRLLAELFDAVPHPLAYSAVTDLFRPLGGVFLHEEIAHGAAGLEFMSFRELQAYHTMLNSPERLDPGLVQHVGSYQLALARRLGDAGLDRLGGAEEVFFTLAGGLVIRYPAAWAAPLAVGTGLLLAAVVGLGLRRRRLSWGGLVGGALAFPAAVVGTVALVTIGWWAIRTLHPDHRVVLLGASYDAPVYLVGLLALAGGAASGIYGAIQGRGHARADGLAAGALLWWSALALLTAVALPGASYLFAWPLLAGLLVLASGLSRSGAATDSWRRAAALALGAVPLLLLVPPLVPILFAFQSYLGYPWMPTAHALGGLASVPAALALGVLVPHLGFLAAGRRWLVPALATLAGVAVIGYTALASEFDADRPRPNSIAYLLDADRGEAAWLSGDDRRDAWTAQFFADGAERAGFAPLPDLLPDALLPGWRAAAPVVALPAPRVAVLADAVDGPTRRLVLRVSSPRGAPDLIVDVEATGDMAAALDGKPLDWGATPVGSRRRLHLAYHAAPPPGIELVVEAPAGPIALRVEDRSNGLPAIPGFDVAPRPPDTMPAMYLHADPTIVRRSLTLGPPP